MSRRLMPLSAGLSQSPILDATGPFPVPGVRDAVEIGRGTRATVYRATQPALDRTVAVKLANDRPDAAARLRFEHEAFALGAMSSHPHVLTLHEVATTADGRPYLLLEFCSGGSLAEHVARRGPLTWPAAARIAVDLADALAWAHRSRLLHRDLKPRNVLISEHGRALLADFGVAAVRGDRLPRATMRLGSVLYTAPEILDGDPATASSDVYSLAATVYFLLTGLAPIPARFDEGWASLYVRLVAAPPARLPQRLPAGLRELLYRSLAKDPGDRPGGAAEFATAVQEAAASAGRPPIDLPTRRDWAGAPIRALPAPPAAPGVPGSPGLSGLPPQRAGRPSKSV